MSYLPRADSVLCKQLRSGAECCAAEARITNERLRTAAAFVSSAMQALAGESFSHRCVAESVPSAASSARVLILARLPTAGAEHGIDWLDRSLLVTRHVSFVSFVSFAPLSLPTAGATPHGRVWRGSCAE